MQSAVMRLTAVITARAGPILAAIATVFSADAMFRGKEHGKNMEKTWTIHHFNFSCTKISRSQLYGRLLDTVHKRYCGGKVKYIFWEVLTATALLSQ